MTLERAVAIDSASTRDADDAVWAEQTKTGWNVHIVIAEVASAVPDGSEIDKAARALGATSYYSQGVRKPMLPPSLTFNTLALSAENKRPSISLVQRHLRIGYNRAARLLEDMEKAGLVSKMGNGGNREILHRASE